LVGPTPGSSLALPSPAVLDQRDAIRRDLVAPDLIALVERSVRPDQS